VVLERQRPPNGRPAITIITFDQKTKEKGTIGVMGVWLKDESPPMVVVRPELTAIIEQAVLKLEGWWVPKKWTTDAGQELPTIFRNMGDLKTTRVSALPAPPPESQPFHIGHLHLYCNPQLTPDECDKALEVLQLLVDVGKIKVIEVQEDWLLFLSAPYAEDLGNVAKLIHRRPISLKRDNHSSIHPSATNL
jgi:hypothetical protein